MENDQDRIKALDEISEWVNLPFVKLYDEGGATERGNKLKQIHEYQSVGGAGIVAPQNLQFTGSFLWSEETI